MKLFEQGELDEAFTMLKRACKLNPDNADYVAMYKELRTAVEQHLRDAEERREEAGEPRDADVRKEEADELREEADDPREAKEFREEADEPREAKEFREEADDRFVEWDDFREGDDAEDDDNDEGDFELIIVTPKNAPEDGEDVTIDYNLPRILLEEGRRRFEVKFKRVVRCRDCRGYGEVDGEICPRCAGTCTLPTVMPIYLMVPPDINDGTVMVCRGAGRPGIYGGVNGDLKIVIHLTDEGKKKLFGLF